MMSETGHVKAKKPAGPFNAFERGLAWRYLRARRSEGGISSSALISIIGIALAVMALIVSMALMSGFRTKFIESVVGGQGHIRINVQPYAGEEVLGILEELEALQGIMSATPIVEGAVLLEGAEGSTGAFVRAIRAEDMAIYPPLADLVGATEFGEGRKGGNTIFLAGGVAKEIQNFDTLGPLTGEDRFKVLVQSNKSTQTAFGTTPGRQKTYRVGGVFNTGYAELDKRLIIMPLEQAQLMIGQKGRYSAIDIRLVDFDATEAAMAQIRPIIGNQVGMVDWKSNANNRYALQNVETSRTLIRIILLILILITALNIITGVVMLVKNKSRDIAILRTIGESRASVLRVFLMIGTALGVTGAAIGLALGVVFVLNISAIEQGINLLIDGAVFSADVYGLDGLPAELAAKDIAFTIIWALLVSILVTIPPAWIAARTDPVDALRFE